MFVTPFLIGLAGSLHCIGMCSPLAIAVTRAGKKAVYRNLTYNLGRIVTYAVLGAIVSLLGMGLNIAGMQQSVSIVAGAAILVAGLANIDVATPSFISRPLSKLVALIRSKASLNPLLMGMVNGLIPCGMTFVALGYCITLGSPSEGFIAMLFFGLGTMPAMFGISSIMKKVISRFNFSYHRIQATLLILSGVILIGRGVSNYHLPIHSDRDDGIVICGSTGK